MRRRSLQWALATLTVPSFEAVSEDTCKDTDSYGALSAPGLPKFSSPEDLALFWGPLWDTDTMAVVSHPFRDIHRSVFSRPDGRMRKFTTRKMMRSMIGDLEEEESRPAYPSQRYQYAPIKGGSDGSIRILCLEAATDCHELRFRLEDANLSSLTHGYEALSYCWGSQRDYQSRLYSPKGRIEVSSNLFEALVRLQRSDGPRYLWVDSICINQDDEEEKGKQVQLMCEIYRRATSVLVWLGSTDLHRAIAAFSILSAVASGGQVAGRPVGNAHFLSNGVSSVGVRGLPGGNGPPPLDSELWEFVVQLFEARWFQRVWCIQEVAVARRATILWGDAEMSWRWVGLAASRIRVQLFQLVSRYDLSGIFNAYLMYRLSQGDAAAEPVIPSFLELLAMTCQFHVTDTRDRIYGLLGLPTSDSDPQNRKLFIDPDYSVQLEEVNTKVGVKVLTRSQSLKILCCVQHRREITYLSWIPRWNSIFTPMLAQFTGETAVSASGHVISDHELVNDNRVLRARGIRLGTVVNQFGFFPTVDKLNDDFDNRKFPRPGSLDPPAARFRSLLGVFGKSDEEAKSNTSDTSDTSDTNDATTLDALLREPEGQKHLCYTLTAGRNWQGHTMVHESGQQQQHLADFAAFLDESPETQGLMMAPKLKDGVRVGEASRFAEAMRNLATGRMLFSMGTGNGTQGVEIGLGPDLIQAGDRICVLFGCPVLLCLRPEGKSGGYYSLIGECYLHNYMQGQAIDLWKGGVLEAEVFYIH